MAVSVQSLLGSAALAAGSTPARTRGPLGFQDAADPNWLAAVPGDSPGPLGHNDFGMCMASSVVALPTPMQGLDADVDSLTVSAGQITFDAEGNDDKFSRFFSRVLHWPGGRSGVTLARGYDMGGRTATSVQADLVRAGLASELANVAATGAGKSGVDAAMFVNVNRDKIGTIPASVQRNLFEATYPGYVARAKANYDRWTSGEVGRLEWDKLDQAIRDMLVDFVYQGFTGGPKPMMSGMHNDYDVMIKYIEETPEINRYERGRKRAAYLRARRPSRNLQN